jgi:transcriptional regulator of met regulon
MEHVMSNVLALPVANHGGGIPPVRITDLFGDVPPDPPPPNRPKRRVPQSQSEPLVVNGGMFALNDTLSPERFSANYVSGASAYFDALGLANAGRDIGVVADLIRPRLMSLLKRLLKSGHHVFCDSGAYGARAKFESGESETPVADFPQVFAVYNELLADLPRSQRTNLALVGPDVLKDWQASMDVLQQYRSEVLHLVTSGANVIIPVQRGPIPAGETVQRIAKILGTKDFTLGIPSASAAMRLPDIATIRDVKRLHILGRGTMNLALYRRAYAVLHNSPGATLACDANQLRKRLDEIGEEQKRLVEERQYDVMRDGPYDETELIYEVLHQNAWLPKGTVKALATFYGVTDPKLVNGWVKAHREGEGALAPLVEQVDPEATLLMGYGLARVFGEAAMKDLSARMRAVAVETVFTEPAQSHVAEKLAA